jgi:hypothetical protein
MGHLTESSGRFCNARTLAKRIQEVRVDLFGSDGVRVVAGLLHVPEQTWQHFESGVVMPAELLLGFIETTGVDPHLLLYGQGCRYQARSGRKAKSLNRDALPSKTQRGAREP